MLKYTPAKETPDRLRNIMRRLSKIVQAEGLMASLVITDGKHVTGYCPTDPPWSSLHLSLDGDSLRVRVDKPAPTVVQSTVAGLALLYSGTGHHFETLVGEARYLRQFIGDVLPDTIEEAAGLLEDWMSPDEREWARRTPLYEAMPMIAGQGFGLQLRQKWSGGDPVKMREDLQKRFGLFGHTDDLLPLILTILWSKVRGEPAEVTQQGLELEVEGMKAHWRREGVDPATGERGIVVP